MLLAIGKVARLRERLCSTVAHGLGIRTLPADQLEGREQGGLTRAGLTGEHREPARELNRRLLDKG